MIDVVTTLMKKFADDTKIGSITDTALQCEKLQEQIGALIHWADNVCRDVCREVCRDASGQQKLPTPSLKPLCAASRIC